MSAGTTAGIVGSFIAPRAQDTRQRHRHDIVDNADEGDGGDGPDNIGVSVSGAVMTTVVMFEMSETKLIFPKAEIPRLQITQSVRVCRSVPTLQIVKDPCQIILERIVR